MVITQTPFRMSFFGGGTDFSGFYDEYGGSVLSSTFDKYCVVTVSHLPRFFEYKNQVTYSKIERVKEVDEIEHPAVRESMKFLDMHELRIAYDADLPARTGLGTSSSFVVGMLNAFYALKGKYADKKRLAEEAIYVERVLCKESGGIQDQIAAAYGGFNRINFNKDGFEVHPVVISKERKSTLNGNLMLFFTGISRISAKVASAQVKEIKNKTNDLKEMLRLVDEAEKILVSKGDLNDFGRLLDYTWKLKRGITTEISSDKIDYHYQKAIEAGALGGKLLGAGGGGFLLFYVEQDKQRKVAEALNDLLYIPFEFESQGTRIMYYKPEDFELQIK